MENSLIVGFSQQVALKRQMDLIANNIANMSTAGYRAQNMVFSEYVVKPKGIENPLSMVMDYGQFQSTAPGPLQRTENPLDVALEGPGYFGVQTPEGLMYTRGGNFHMDAAGNLMTSAGHPVAGEGGGAIIIPSGAKEIRIAEDGTVSTDQGAVGKLMVTEFTNEQTLDPAGNGLYRASEGGTAATNTRMIQGMLEGSNVQPVVEMTRMVEVLRTYQGVQRMLQTEHDLQRTMIQRLTRAG